MKPVVLFWLYLFGLGLALGGMAPYVGPWAVRQLGASTQVIGDLYAGAALVSMVCGPLLGLLTDRSGRRRRVIACCLGLGGTGMLLMAQAHSLALAVPGMLATSAGGMVMGLLLVAAGDALRREAGRAGSGSMSLVRMGFSLGFVAGAPLGGVLAQAQGYDGLLRTLAGGLLLMAALATVLLPENTTAATERRGAPAPRGSLAPLILFCLAGTLAMISDQAKTQFLPLRLTQQLHLQPSSIGLLFGFQAVLELLTMPLTGRLADRLGMTPVLLVTFALPIPYLLGVSSATSLGPLFALQILQASAVAGFSALAFAQAQVLAPGREGFATTLYGAGFSASQFAAGLLVGGMAQWAGIAGSLRLCTVPVALGCLVLLVALRRRPPVA